MQRITGTYLSNTMLGEAVRSFVPQALVRLSVVTGLVPSVATLTDLFDHEAGLAIDHPVQITLPICNDAVVDARVPTA